jgi:hypothetical protein
MRRLPYYFALCLIASTCLGQQAFVTGQSFYDDFEIGGTDNWTGQGFGLPSTYTSLQACGSGSASTYGVSTVQPHSGNYSLVNVLSSSTTADCRLYDTLYVALSGTIHGQFYIYTSGLSISNGDSWLLENVGNASFSAANNIDLYATGGSNYIYAASCSTGKQGSHAISGSAWHVVQWTLNTTAGTFTSTLDGASDVSASGCPTGFSVSNLSLGIYTFASGGISGTIHLDDVVVNSSSLSTPGPVGVVARHPEPFGRTALPILATLWGTSNGDTLVTSIDGSQVSSIAVTSNAQSYSITCCSAYSAGSHTLLVQEKTGSTVNASWTETITTYGAPTISAASQIDGNNNLLESGSAIFPIFPYIVSTICASSSNESCTGFWPSQGITTANGWTVADPNSIYTPSTFNADVNSIESTTSGLRTLGPNCGGDAGADNWQNCDTPPVAITSFTGTSGTLTFTNSGSNGLSAGNQCTLAGFTGANLGLNFNQGPLTVISSSLSSTTFELAVAGSGYASGSGLAFCSQNVSVASYASTLKNNSNLFGWSWMDEPFFNTIGGKGITAAVYQNWATVTHQNDPNHLVGLGNVGYEMAAQLTQGYFGSTQAGDILSMDSYPIESYCTAQTSGAYPNGTANRIALWTGYVDQYLRMNYGLVPMGFALEANINSDTCYTDGYTATGNQLRMEEWLAVIHGAKFITLFVPQYGAGGSEDTSADQLSGLGAFYTLSQTPSVLAALTSPATSLTVTSNQTVTGTRVDAMVKQAGSTVTVFGQRLTDCTNATNGTPCTPETDSGLGTTFTVNGCSYTGTATVINESRTVPVTNCALTDTFDAYDTHVYQFSTDGPAAPSGLKATVN